VITVAQDVEGIRKAALELFDESLREKDIGRMIENAVHAEDLNLLERVVPKPSVARGYREWVIYLIWLKGKIDTGVKFDLFADEAEGLTTLMSARHEFESEHPCCFKCGARQYSKVSFRCRSCGVEFKR